VRNALILLAVVAMVILVMGALNNGTTFEVDYVAGTVSAVSLFWVSAVVAGLVFVAGLAATWFALTGAAGGRRKLEAELQSTYERLREAEALAVRSAPEPEWRAAADTVVQGPSVVVEAAAPPLVSGGATVVVDEIAEDTTVVAGEALTNVPGEDVTRVSAGAVEPPAEPGEHTAVTATGAAQAGEEGEDAGAEAQSGAADPAADEPRPSGS
jgi:hypothetical protein